MPTPTTPTTLNEALAEIEVLTTQIAYLQEQAAIASAITNKVIPDNSTAVASVATAITNKVIPDNSTAVASVATAITNKEIPDYSTVFGNIDTELETIADNTAPPTPSTPASPPPAPTVNTGYVSY